MISPLHYSSLTNAGSRSWIQSCVCWPSLTGQSSLFLLVWRPGTLVSAFLVSLSAHLHYSLGILDQIQSPSSPPWRLPASSGRVPLSSFSLPPSPLGLYTAFHTFLAVEAVETINLYISLSYLSKFALILASLYRSSPRPFDALISLNEPWIQGWPLVNFELVAPQRLRASSLSLLPVTWYLDTCFSKLTSSKFIKFTFILYIYLFT